MKVLFDHSNPLLLAHGGFQTQIEETKKGLESVGVDVEYLRWWDTTQSGDIIHFFGVAPVDYIERARGKGLKIVQTALLTETCNRSDLRLRMQGAIVRSFLASPIGAGIKRQLSWKSFLLSDMNVVGLEAERQVLEWVYGVSPDRIFVLPLGLPEEFFSAGPASTRGDDLICVGTITERKNSIPLARLAQRAEVPILFAGKPYSETDPYWKEFSGLVDGRWVKYQTHVATNEEMIQLLRSSRGCVVMSRYENWCLAAHEAAACGLPLLLPPLKWAQERFANEASYFSGKIDEDVRILQDFYHQARTLRPPQVKLFSWNEVGARLGRLYQDLASTSR
jgi:glycosyltransferase involved in cell wall biosynthesis